MALLRYKIGVIYTPGGSPGTTPQKVKMVVSSVFPRSQEPVDLESCRHEAVRVQNALATTLDLLQATTGVFGTSPAYGTFSEPVRDTDL